MEKTIKREESLLPEGSVLLGVIEGRSNGYRLLGLAPYLYLQLDARPGVLLLHEGYSNANSEERGAGSAGYLSYGLSVRVDGIALPRNSPVDHLEVHHLPAEAALPLLEEGLLSYELLVPEDGEVEVGLEGRNFVDVGAEELELLGLVAVERVAGLKPEGVPRSESSWLYAVLLPGIEDGLPDVEGLLRLPALALVRVIGVGILEVNLKAVAEGEKIANEFVQLP